MKINEASHLKFLNFYNETITIRNIQEQDAHLLLNWRLKKKEFFFSEISETVDSWITFIKKEYLEHPKNILIIIEADKQPLGQASLYNINNDQAELGRIVRGEETIGKGAMEIGLRSLIHIGFKQLSLSFIVLNVFSDNKRAINLYQKIGFNLDEKFYLFSNDQKNWNSKSDLENPLYQKQVNRMILTKEGLKE